MKKSLPGILLLTLPLLAASTFTHAEEVKFVPRVEAGLQNYTYTFEKDVPDTFSTDMIGAGVTAIYGQFYLDVDFKMNFTSGTSGSEDPYDNFGYNYISSDEFDRKDMAITGGYSFGEVSIFAGYKHGKTEKSTSSTVEFYDTNTQDEPITQSGSLTSSGIFIGASYSLMLSDTDVLSFSMAYADLSIELKIDEAKYGNQVFDLGFTDEYDGDGLSVSGKWSHYLESGKSVYLKFETQNYDYVENDGAKENETLSRLTFGVTF